MGSALRAPGHVRGVAGHMEVPLSWGSCPWGRPQSTARVTCAVKGIGMQCTSPICSYTAEYPQCLPGPLQELPYSSQGPSQSSHFSDEKAEAPNGHSPQRPLSVDIVTPDPLLFVSLGPCPYSLPPLWAHRVTGVWAPSPVLSWLLGRQRRGPWGEVRVQAAALPAALCLPTGSPLAPREAGRRLAQASSPPFLC